MGRDLSHSAFRSVNYPYNIKVRLVLHCGIQSIHDHVQFPCLDRQQELEDSMLVEDAGIRRWSLHKPGKEDDLFGSSEDIAGGRSGRPVAALGLHDKTICVKDALCCPFVSLHNNSRPSICGTETDGWKQTI